MAGAYGWQSYHLHVPIFLEILGTSTSWSPKGLSRPVKGYISPTYHRHVVDEIRQERVLICFIATALISVIMIHNTGPWSVVSAVHLWVVIWDPALWFPSTSRPSPTLNMRVFYSSPLGKSFTGRGSLPMSSHILYWKELFNGLYAFSSKRWVCFLSQQIQRTLSSTGMWHCAY